jgi:hypothetical protein
MINSRLGGLDAKASICNAADWPNAPARLGPLPSDSLIVALDVGSYRTFVALPDSPNLDTRRSADVVREWVELATYFDTTDLGALVVANVRPDMREQLDNTNDPLSAFVDPLRNVVYLNPAYVTAGVADRWERVDAERESQGYFASTNRLKVLGIVDHEVFHLVHRQLDTRRPDGAQNFASDLAQQFLGTTNIDSAWYEDGEPASPNDTRFDKMRAEVSTYATVGLAELAAELFRAWRGGSFGSDKIWYEQLIEEIRS